MPGKDSINPTDVYKTSAVVSFTNLLMSPLFPRLGLGPSSLLIGAGLYALHEVGKNKQTGSGWFPGLFSPKAHEKMEPHNIASNVFAGGGSVFDKFVPPKP